jgi:hypothetical protein
MGIVTQDVQITIKAYSAINRYQLALNAYDY